MDLTEQIQSEVVDNAWSEAIKENRRRDKINIIKGWTISTALAVAIPVCASLVFYLGTSYAERKPILSVDNAIEFYKSLFQAILH